MWWGINRGASLGTRRSGRLLEEGTGSDVLKEDWTREYWFPSSGFFQGSSLKYSDTWFCVLFIFIRRGSQWCQVRAG